MLVGLLKATSADNPPQFGKLEKTSEHGAEQHVHAPSHAEGTLWSGVYRQSGRTDGLQNTPVKLNFNVENAYDGKALYFREAVKDYIREKCPDVDVYSDGLKIYTTLDSRMQAYAEKAMREQMQTVQNNFNGHWRGMGDPWRSKRVT